MKKVEKFAVVAAIVLIPLSIFSHDKYNDHDNKKGVSERSQFFGDDDILDNAYYQSKGINYEFEGVIEKKPKGTLNGEWLISGIKVIVDDNTLISHSKNKLIVGEEVELLAKRENGKITAIELEED